MKNAKDIVLSGMSAGAMAALYWADYLGTLIDKTKTKYVVVPDSGFTHDIEIVDWGFSLFKYINNFK